MTWVVKFLIFVSSFHLVVFHSGEVLQQGKFDCVYWSAQNQWGFGSPERNKTWGSLVGLKTKVGLLCEPKTSGVTGPHCGKNLMVCWSAKNPLISGEPM